MYNCAYLIGIIYALGLLGLFALTVPKSITLMIQSALIWAPVAPILEYWHHQDYWRPTYLIPIQLGSWRFGIEDYLFGVTCAGICAGLFDLLIKESGHKAEARLRKFGFAKLLILPLVVAPISMFILSSFLGLNSVYAIVILGITSATLIFLKRPEWIFPAFQTAFLTGVICWVSYYVFYLKLFPHSQRVLIPSTFGLYGKWR